MRNDIRISPCSMVAFIRTRGQDVMHSGGASMYQVLLPFIIACHDGRFTPSI